MNSLNIVGTIQSLSKEKELLSVWRNIFCH